jgi:hypothetical protein
MTTYLSLGPAEVFKGAQIRAHRDVSVRLLQETMAKLAAAGAQQSGLAARFGARTAQLAEQQVQDAPTRLSEPGSDRPLSGRLRPSQPLDHDHQPTYTNLHEMDEVEKQAFIFRLARRGAAALARRGGRAGRVGSFLQKPLRSPVTATAGKGSASVGVRSPLGKAPIVTNKTIPKPGVLPEDDVAAAIAKKGGGPGRAPGTRAPKKSQGKAVKRKAPEGPTPEPRGGYLRKPIKGLAAAGLISGGLYAASKGGSRAVNELQQATARPMPANVSGHSQYGWGFNRR